MANEIQAAFDTVYADGSLTNPQQPSKSEIRDIVGATIQSEVDRLQELISVGFHVGEAVDLATTGNITLSGEQTIDGSLTSTSRILARIQTNSTQNGIWITGPGAWTRATDADSGVELKGLLVSVLGGTANVGRVYGCANTGTITVGTTDITFEMFLDQADYSGLLALKADQVDLDEANAHIEAIEGDPLLNADYADGWTDREGNFLIGIRHDGTVDVNDMYPLLDDRFKYAVTDVAGNVMFAVYHDDTLFTGARVEDWVVYQVSGNLIAYNGARRAQITFDATTGYGAPSVADDFAIYFKDNGSTVSEVSEELTASTTLSGAVDRLRHVLIYGQSLSEGSFSVPALHTAPVRAGRAVMFNAGARTRGGNDAADPFVPDHMYSLIDLLENSQEGPGPGLGWALTVSGALASDEAALVSAHGRGGTPFVDLQQGTQIYANLLEAVRRARVIASLRERDYDVIGVQFTHGESDRTMSQSAYQANLVTLQDDLTTDINGLSGGSGEVILSVDQMSNWSAYGNASSQVPMAQLHAALDNPTKIICACPKYFLPTVADGIHLTNASSARLGSYHGRAIRKQLAGPDWLPLYCTGATRSGAVVTLTYHVPIGPLVLDTTAVSDPGNYGFEWEQTGGTTRTISSVAISGSTIVITLSGDPGSPSIQTVKVAMGVTGGELGGPTTGPRCNLRDSAADLDIDGNAMPNWACHQTITVI